jgi:hypothetical protein
MIPKPPTEEVTAQMAEFKVLMANMSQKSLVDSVYVRAGVGGKMKRKMEEKEVVIGILKGNTGQFVELGMR